MELLTDYTVISRLLMRGMNFILKTLPSNLEFFQYHLADMYLHFLVVVLLFPMHDWTCIMSYLQIS